MANRTRRFSTQQAERARHMREKKENKRLDKVKAESKKPTEVVPAAAPEAPKLNPYERMLKRLDADKVGTIKP